MDWFLSILKAALLNIFSFNQGLYEIVALTLWVSLFALLIATLLALPLAAWLSQGNGWYHRLIIVLINALMSFPPVLAGLFVYLLLSRQGPLGSLGLLFSPTAMIIAQVLLIFPIVCGLSQQVFRQYYQQFSDLFYSLELSRVKALKTIVFESRHALMGAVVTGLGRGLAEVGAVMLVGGNILHHTRTITTTIALETSKGELVTAVSLGLILLLISLVLNTGLFWLNQSAKKSSYHA